MSDSQGNSCIWIKYGCFNTFPLDVKKVKACCFHPPVVFWVSVSSSVKLQKGSFWTITVHCAQRGDGEKKKKIWASLHWHCEDYRLGKAAAHWDSTYQNQELSGTLQTCSQIHRQAHSTADERLLTAVQLNPLIYLAYSLSEISLQLFIANDPRQHSPAWDKHSKFELRKHFQEEVKSIWTQEKKINTSQFWSIQNVCTDFVVSTKDKSLCMKLEISEIKE